MSGARLHPRWFDVSNCFKLSQASLKDQLAVTIRSEGAQGKRPLYYVDIVISIFHFFTKLPRLPHSSVGKAEPRRRDKMASSTVDTWKSLPHKDQLAVLTLCRIVDFFQMVSFQTICYYQLKSFDSSVSEQVLSWQTGVALASFTAVQSCTAIPWGYVADAKWGGRKNALLIGLLGTSLSCVGVAFSTSFSGVVIFRALGGAVNGTVGVVRTMMSEVIRHKR